MGGTVPPLPQYAFMAWCSVRGNTEKSGERKGTGLNLAQDNVRRRAFVNTIMKLRVPQKRGIY
jgi:hypothetical protein